MGLLLNNLKALSVVLMLAIVVFAVAKPFCLQFMTAQDYERRRNIWVALTVTAFLSPSFWLYVLLAVPLLVWGARKDANAVGLYVLVMHVIPPIGLHIPVVVINDLFKLESYRILSFAILVPALWRLSQQENGFGRLSLIDSLVLAYGVLHIVLLMPYESITHTMRRTFLFSIDVLALYFVISRVCSERKALVDTVASFCLACAILVPIGLFESVKGWLLYAGVVERWGDTTLEYLQRAGVLRAQASAGHSLSLGYLLAIGFGFWLYLSSRTRAGTIKVGLGLWLWAGLIAAYSRAPWFVAYISMLTYFALGPNGINRCSKVIAASALVAGVVLISPFGERFIDSLPFVGSIDSETVVYRQRLAETAWRLIQMNPIFGTPHVLMYLESLRQGQGIIDLLNAYATVAMYYGLAGLVLFLGPLVLSVWHARKIAKAHSSDEDRYLLGIALISCMFGTFFMMATGGIGRGQMLYFLTALTVAYVRGVGALEAPKPLRANRIPVARGAVPMR